jgi:hypothetical protein
MSVSVVQPWTDSEVEEVLSLHASLIESLTPSVISKKRTEFTLPPSLLTKLSQALQISLQNPVPALLVKGDSFVHKDEAPSPFTHTYLFYLTDSSGSLIVGDSSYPIQKGTLYKFPYGMEHGTQGTGYSLRISIGPMNEQGLPVGYSPITYFSNEADAVAVNFAGFLGGSYTTTVGAEDYGNLQGITHWRIASSSTGSSSQIPVYNNGDILNNDGYYFMFPGYPLTHTIQETTAAVFPTPPPQATTGSFVNPLVDPLFTPASITSLKGWWDANDPYGNGTQPAPLSVFQPCNHL